MNLYAAMTPLFVDFGFGFLCTRSEKYAVRPGWTVWAFVSPRSVFIRAETACAQVLTNVPVSTKARLSLYCSAFVLGSDRALRRSNDDGEPAGTDRKSVV